MMCVVGEKCVVGVVWCCVVVMLAIRPSGVCGVCVCVCVCVCCEVNLRVHVTSVADWVICWVLQK